MTLSNFKNVFGSNVLFTFLHTLHNLHTLVLPAGLDAGYAVCKNACVFSNYDDYFPLCNQTRCTSRSYTNN